MSEENFDLLKPYIKQLMNEWKALENKPGIAHRFQIAKGRIKELKERGDKWEKIANDLAIENADLKEDCSFWQKKAEQWQHSYDTLKTQVTNVLTESTPSDHLDPDQSPSQDFSSHTPDPESRP